MKLLISIWFGSNEKLNQNLFNNYLLIEKKPYELELPPQTQSAKPNNQNEKEHFHCSGIFPIL